MLQDCDSAVNKICELCGWTDDLRKLVGCNVQKEEHKSKTKEQCPNSHKQTHKTGHTHNENK